MLKSLIALFVEMKSSVIQFIRMMTASSHVKKQRMWEKFADTLTRNKPSFQQALIQQW